MSALRLQAICGVMFLFHGTLALGDIVSLNPVADNTIYETSAGNLANGTGTAMFAGRNSGTSNSKRRALVRFDFTSIPAGATINSVSLRLYESAANVDPASVSLHVAAQSWGEGASLATGGQGGGAPAATGDATWLNRFYPSNFWNAAGGDYAAAASASTTVVDPGFYDWSSAGLLSDVISFYLNPSTNFGWFLIGDESFASSAKRFATREEPDVNSRPVLSVTYQVPEPVPFTLAVFVAGVCACHRRMFSNPHLPPQGCPEP